MNVTAMFECRTAEQTEVNGKMYCKGHETKYGGKEIGEPLDRCQHCRQWIGNRKVLKPGKYAGSNEILTLTQEQAKEIVAFLKEQEAVKPVPPEDEFGLYRCGKCYHQLFRCVDKYCSRCGRAVKWDG